MEVPWREIDSPEHYVGATSPNHPQPIGTRLRVSDIQTGNAPVPGPIVINTGFLDDLPGLEIIGEGISVVAPGSVAIGRQGRFLFWGFHDAPDKMTDWGRRLLVNCVHYIHSKRDTLTIAYHAPARQMIAGYLEQARRVHKQERNFLEGTPKLLVVERRKDWKPTFEFTEAWIKENLDYIYAPAPDKKTDYFNVDEDAKRLKTPNNKLSSLEKWIELAGSDDKDREIAARCLDRYVEASIKPTDNNWRAWFKRMKDRIRFVDTVGFKFIEDPLLLEREGKRPGGLYR